MINWALYKRGMKGSIRLLVIFSAIITLYVSVIISMYDPELMQTLDGFVVALPELMAAVGMSAGATSLLGFMVSYLYGFILLILPMVFCILRGNGLIAKYLENNSMVSLIAAPIKRCTIALTQIGVLISGILFLVFYSTVLEIVCAETWFPGELDTTKLLSLNIGLLCLHLFIGGICFLSTCAFSDTKYSIGFGAGIPALMLILQMISNVGGNAEKAKYFTFFALFNPSNIVERDSGSSIEIFALLGGAIILYFGGTIVFNEKELHI